MSFWIYLVVFVVGVFSTTDKTTNIWCLRDNEVIIHEQSNDTSCHYPGYSVGFDYTQTASLVTFTVFPDCCSTNVTIKENNKFHVLDEEDNQYTTPPNRLLEFYFYGTLYARDYLNITIEEYIEKLSWTINTYYIISGSTLTLMGRASTNKKYPYYISVESRQFNISSPTPNYEYVEMGFQWGFSPTLFLHGYLDVEMVNETARENCQYRYTTVGDTVKYTRGVNNSQLKVVSACDRGGYHRIEICGVDVLQTDDCACSYDNYEYKNHAQDCTYLSRYFDFYVNPKQDKIPYEHLWNSLITSEEDTLLTIRKGANLTFLGEVVLKSPLRIDGSVYFKGQIVIESTEYVYDLGNFYIESVDYSKVDKVNNILFIGKCGVNTSECDAFLARTQIDEIRCNGPRNRYVKKGSVINCMCTQDASGNFEQSDCNYMTEDRQNRMTLQLTTNYSSGNTTKYWKEIIGKPSESITIRGSSIVVEGNCDFSKITSVEVYAELRCGKIVLTNTNNIRGGFNSIIKTYDIEIIGVVDNLNRGALIQMNEGYFVSDGNMIKEFDDTQSTCFELVTTHQAVSETLNGATDSKFVTLVLGNLVRICPNNYTNDDKTKVKCQVVDYSFETFENAQCPCKGDYCEFYCDLSHYNITNNSFCDTIEGDLYFSGENIVLQNVRSIRILHFIDNAQVTVLGNGKTTVDIEIESKNKIEIVTHDNINIGGMGKSLIFTLNETQGAKKVQITGKFVDLYVDVPNGTSFELTQIASIFNTKSTGGFKVVGTYLVYLSTLKCQVGHLVDNEFVCDSCGQGEVSGKCKESITVTHCEEYSSVGLCKECFEGWYLESDITNSSLISQKCIECSDINCLRCSKSECLKCKDEMKTSGNGCVINRIAKCVSQINGNCVKCNEGYFVVNGNCKICGEHCKSCVSQIECTICDYNYKLMNGTCLTSLEGVIETTNSILSCPVGYFNDKSTCKKCITNTTFGDSCMRCTKTECLTCDGQNSIIDGKCQATNGECDIINDSKCQRCNYGTFNKPYCETCDTLCESCVGSHGECLECSTTSQDIWLFNTTCEQIVSTSLFPYIKTEDETYSQCVINHFGTCISCSSGYYVNNTKCVPCSSHCASCFNSTICLSCTNATDSLVNHNCLTDDKLSESCKVMTISKIGCAICMDGYYRKGTECFKCPVGVELCVFTQNVVQPISCTSDYFLFNANECVLYSNITHCASFDKNGCAKCEDTYYMSNSYCSKCVSNCQKCTSSTSCVLCERDYVLSNDICVDYTNIQFCTSSSKNKCDSCDTFHKLENSICVQKSLWWISLIVLGGVVLLVIILYFTITYILRKAIRLKQENTMNLSDIFTFSRFIEALPGILVTQKTFTLYDEDAIPVNEETPLKIVVANSGKHKVKIQPSFVVSKKYDMSITPSLVFLRPGKAIEFVVTVHPMCSTKIEQQIVFSVFNFHVGQELQFTIGLSVQTQQSSIIDPDELIQKKQIGEGTFGVVFLGDYRGNKVAIKRLKPKMSNGDNQEEEFLHEVEMLEKFRSDYIIHFYGAVYLGDERAIITEFAQYGSIEKMIESKEKKQVRRSLRVKMLQDTAKGIMYLHNNGILHRDIKPDNMLVLIVDANVRVNAKLTDFGSARNINLMMTNMTFTKGVGTPSFMAPEVLNKKRYKTAADVFSFGVTMYSVMIWDDPYPKELFSYPWIVATFIAEGKRRPKANLPDRMYNLISQCWTEDVNARLKIEEVVEKLEELLKTDYSK
ncbi:protein serine/threonine kinase, putative [Entamoeba invadens IP1]|uniref:Protein serine/threonine kinase, putative n=1 Tax=Entamoeba invadens IP1 TaxID=370355 RepID=A0A0A1TXZ1_ENTIV|nr:protein serine/threonine kinase, putative [Entamoeba invadens IP1]ELP86262.1 protein serine/threonine kinase, putative [Entamoeba invadens IP1]|eukprot:XP_004185608.1 protein serine/threonine kinase, putative [Entamoeba invadens IP1]